MTTDADLVARSCPDGFTLALVANLAVGALDRHVWLWARDGSTIATVFHVFADLEPTVLRKVGGQWRDAGDDPARWGAA